MFCRRLGPAPKTTPFRGWGFHLARSGL